MITGSFNWSPSAAHQNDEVLMLIHSPLLAAHFTREMDRLWKGAELGITAGLIQSVSQAFLSGLRAWVEVGWIASSQCPRAFLPQPIST